MRLWLSMLLGLVFVVGLSTPGRAATNLATMQPTEIEALQKRFADDGCYAGPIDGQASPATSEAVKACPDQSPMLRIETGMHVARIDRIGVDANCRILITGSEDKTVRFWTMPEGTLVRTLRLPIGSEDGGRVRSVALSSDGHMLAAVRERGHEPDDQGQTGLYLFSIADATHLRLQRRIEFGNRIEHAVFSRDGSLIALGFKGPKARGVTSGSQGVRVLASATGQEVMADSNYDNDVYGLDFGHDGSLVTTSLDGFLRRYGSDLKQTSKIKASDGEQPYGISVSPDGRRVVVGYEDKPIVSILDAVTLTVLTKNNTVDKLPGDFATVAWITNEMIIAGGGVSVQIGGQRKLVLRRFDLDGRRVGPDLAAANNAILDLKSCGDGLAFAAGDPSFGILDADGKLRSLQTAVTADMRGKLGSDYTISARAESVRFGLGLRGSSPFRFDLAVGTLVEDLEVPANHHAATIQGLPITDWLNSLSPKFGGTPLTIEQGEVSRSLAIRSDRTGFVLGTEWKLRAFDAAGKERWTRTMTGTAWGVNLSDHDDVVVVACGDGTIRWYRWSDGQALLTLFVHAPSKRWVVWTPAGYYMASAGGEDLIGWQLNRGWDQEADFFPASRFRDKFNRPDIVRLVLNTLDEDAAVRQANAAGGNQRDSGPPIIERLPPVIAIVSPTEGSVIAAGTFEVRYRVRVPSGGKLERVEALVDGARIEPSGLGRIEQPKGEEGSVTLSMPARDAVVSLVAYADGRASDAVHVTLKGIASRATAVDDGLKPPSLFALLVGVSHYGNKNFDLGFPAADATSLAEALKAQEGKLYRHVEVKVLTDKEASAAGVKTGLTWLGKQTTAHDLALVFAAGRGLTDAKGKFWFMTTDADLNDLFSTAVSQEDIARVLYALPGKKLLFLDACNSGAALPAVTRELVHTDLSAAINDFAQAEGGVVAYAASTGKELCYERDEWGHGAFTKALIEGLNGKADIMRTGTITTATLDYFLAERVKELTEGRQHPIMMRPNTVPDFPIGAVN